MLKNTFFLSFWQRLSLYFCCFLCTCSLVYGQGEKVIVIGSSSSGETSVEISGKVLDLDSGLPLERAKIHVDGADWGIPTDSSGMYRVFIGPGRHKFTAIKNGYRTESVQVLVNGAGSLDFKLKKWSLTLSEVVVQADKADKSVEGTKPGLTSLSIKGLRVLPAFLGEVDVVVRIRVVYHFYALKLCISPY
jgi:hypothetical protein